MDVQRLLEDGDKHFIPNLSIDNVIIGYKDEDLKCLLIRISDKWMLPGGYILKDHSVEEAALHILQDRTGLKNIYLKFLAVFGDRHREFGKDIELFCKALQLTWRPEYWINNRFVSLTYYSLVDINKTFPNVKGFDEEVAWVSFNELPPMWMDHKAIVLKARNVFKEDIKREHITYNLLPEKFTMPELHKLHQTILDEDIERSRFQKKMIASDRFERLPQLHKKAPGRNPYLYKIKP